MQMFVLYIYLVFFRFSLYIYCSVFLVTKRNPVPINFRLIIKKPFSRRLVGKMERNGKKRDRSDREKAKELEIQKYQ